MKLPLFSLLFAVALSAADVLIRSISCTQADPFSCAVELKYAYKTPQQVRIAMADGTDTAAPIAPGSKSIGFALPARPVKVTIGTQSFEIK